MRLTSTGLGLGTSSPATKLEVSGSAGSNVIAAGVTNTDASGFSVLRLRNTGASGRDYQIGVGGNTSGQNGNLYVFDATASAVRATLDSSGNLGLGVAPSANWSGTGVKAFQFQNGSLAASNTFGTMLAWNAIYDGAYKYVASTTAGMYQFGGAHAWFTAPSGTAGDAISFTQAMTLDASGNLGVGTTSPTSKLTVSGSGATLGQFVSSGSASYIEMDNSGGGGYIGTTGNNLLFLTSTSGTERARITSGGDLLVGTTTLGDAGWSIYGPAVAGGAISKTNGTSTFTHLEIKNGNGTVGSIQSTGSLTLYNTTSDYRLKTVVGPVQNAGQRIDALQPVEYTWNSNGSSTRGFLAHQFQEVYASSVSGTKDAVDAEGKPVYQSMQASSSEVIADLVAEIQSLRARLAAANI
jgi:hypothetical protein